MMILQINQNKPRKNQPRRKRKRIMMKEKTITMRRKRMKEKRKKKASITKKKVSIKKKQVVKKKKKKKSITKRVVRKKNITKRVVRRTMMKVARKKNIMKKVVRRKSTKKRVVRRTTMKVAIRLQLPKKEATVMVVHRKKEATAEAMEGDINMDLLEVEVVHLRKVVATQKVLAIVVIVMFNKIAMVRSSIQPTNLTLKDLNTKIASKKVLAISFLKLLIMEKSTLMAS